MSKLVQTTVMLTEDVRLKAKIEALKERRTLSSIIRELLERWVSGEIELRHDITRRTPKFD